MTYSQGFKVQTPPKTGTYDSFCLLGSFVTLREPILVNNN
jgi:hypothetical protein